MVEQIRFNLRAAQELTWNLHVMMSSSRIPTSELLILRQYFGWIARCGLFFCFCHMKSKGSSIMPNVSTSQCRELGRQTPDQVLFRLHHLCTHLTLGIHSLDLAHPSDMLDILVFVMWISRRSIPPKNSGCHIRQHTPHILVKPWVLSKHREETEFSVAR